METCKETKMKFSENKPYWFLRTLTFVRISRQMTDGAFTLIEQFLAPGSESPYHIHSKEAEVIYVLDGNLSFVVGRERFDKGPNESVFLPKGVPHAFKVLGNNPARILLETFPGEFESFVVEMSEQAKSLEIPNNPIIDVKKLKIVAMRFGIEILSPFPMNVA
ncbi:MAG: cupin domain-containing protein [Bacteroidia bacterium]|nr:cupin domain-containing protein [Bacteroidia bacterium]